MICERCHHKVSKLVTIASSSGISRVCVPCRRSHLKEIGYYYDLKKD